MNELISVIVPAYNVENYIEKCVSSIINQTYTMLEIIIVDDGSTDRTKELVYRLKECDHRISVVTKENGGSASARNRGLSCANGKYVFFIDSDDYIEPDTIEILYNSIKRENADISVVRVAQVYADGHKEFFEYESEKKITIVDLNNKNWLFKDPSIFHPVWNKLYKKSLISFQFDESIRRNEDIEFNGMAYCVANKMVINNVPKYMQLQRTSSLCHSGRKILEEAKTIKHISDVLYEFCKKNNLNKYDDVEQYIALRLDVLLTTVVVDESGYRERRKTLDYIRREFPTWRFSLFHDLKTFKKNPTYMRWGRLYNYRLFFLLAHYKDIANLKARVLHHNQNENNMFQ